jgi:hypothetical protein
MINQTTRLVYFTGLIVITVAASGFIWVLYRHEFDPDDNQAYAPNTCARALELRLADDNQHFTTRIFQDGTLRKTVRLEICNIGNGFLSDCYLIIDDITPIPKFDFRAVTLMAEVTIRINEPQFVPLIEFNEIMPQGTKSSEDPTSFVTGSLVRI